MRSDQVTKTPDEARIVVRGGGGVFGGGKGGSGGGRQPVESANSLRSNAYARALFVVSEGQVDGTASGNILQDIYLDKTPLQSPSGFNNFTGYEVQWRSGTTDQTAIPGFAQAEEESLVGVTVLNSIPVIRTVSRASVGGIRVRLRVPTLRQILDNGDIVGQSVSFAIAISNNGGPYTNYIVDTISGKCTSPYDRSYEIYLPAGGPWDIRVSRTTPDSSDSRIENSLIWQGYTEVDYVQRRYPDTALLALRVNAEQFSSMPSVGIDLRGLRVLVPHNYSPSTRSYNGSFNGSLVPGWTNNPVWCLYDFLTDNVYGASLNPQRIDVYSFYAAAFWCDELVSDGQSGLEPRWTFNAYIDRREDAWTIISAIASSFNGTLYWANGTIHLTVDRLQDPVHLYTPANVIVEYDGNGRLTKPPFSYTTASLTTRHTVAAVTYSEPNEFYEDRVVYVEDAEGIAKWGYRPIDITAYGCTSRTQAKRYGLWRILTERYQEKSISFTVAAEGMFVQPGQVFAVSDPTQAGVSMGGRIASASEFLITLDRNVELNPGNSYTLMTTNGTGSVQQNRVNFNQGSSVSVSELSLVEGFLEVPVPETIWILKTQSVEPSQWLTVNVEEQDDGSYRIDGLEYQPGKYAAIEEGATFDEIDTTTLEGFFDPPAAPDNLQATEILFANTNSSGVRVKVDIFWSHPEPYKVDYYIVQYKLTTDTNWEIAGQSREQSFTAFDLPPGNYDIRVFGKAKLTQLDGAVASIRKTLYGLIAPPKDVTSFFIQALNDVFILQWQESTDLDVLIGGRYSIRYDPTPNSTTWNSSTEIANVSGRTTSATVPPLPGTYFIKAIDSSGNESLNAATDVYDVDEISGFELVATLRDDPGFPGAKDNMQILGDALRLSDTGITEGDLFDNQPGLFDDHPGLFDSQTAGGDQAYGAYYLKDQTLQAYQNPIEGASFVFDRPRAIRLLPIRTFSAASDSDLFDNAIGLFDNQPGLFDGNEADVVNVSFEIQTSNDLATWTSWQILQPSDYTARAAKIRMIVRAPIGVNATFTEIGLKLFVKEFSLSGTIASNGVGLSSFNYDPDFFNTPDLLVTLENPAASGEYVSLGAQANFGFQFVVRDASNNDIPRNIKYLARGA